MHKSELSQHIIENYLPNYYSRDDIGMFNNLRAVANKNIQDQSLIDRHIGYYGNEIALKRALENQELEFLSEAIAASMEDFTTPAKDWSVVERVTGIDNLSHHDIAYIILNENLVFHENVLEALGEVFELNHSPSP